MAHLKSKIIDGKRYTFHYASDKRKNAEAEADRVRKLGYRARVLTSKDNHMFRKHVVYIR